MEHPADPTQRREMVRILYVEVGLSTRAIAKRFGVTPMTISRDLRVLNIPARPWGGKR